MIKYKAYLSDEGFGHIVRHSAILNELKRLEDSIFPTIQTYKHATFAKELISDAEIIEKFNNITWDKKENGSPDLEKIGQRFSNYKSKSEAFIKEELKSLDYDFIISDFVYEAFEVAANRNIPSFGVAHFTWDWFFSKLYPPVIESSLIHGYIKSASKARRIYFPPFTPEEVLKCYTNSKKVPFIVRKGIKNKSVQQINKIKILIIDSGSGLLKPSIQRFLNEVGKMDEFHFLISSAYTCYSTNVTFIDKNELLADYIGDVDLVVGRAGFNTISECIGMRTPMLLIGEAMNPEINENIINLKKAGLGSFISLETFELNLHNFLLDFMDKEYVTLQNNMNNHQFETNGAEIVAQDILNNI